MSAIGIDSSVKSPEYNIIYLNRENILSYRKLALPYTGLGRRVAYRENERECCFLYMGSPYISILYFSTFVCIFSCWHSVCSFAKLFLALAKNAICLASGEPGEARERIGTANPCQMKFGQTKFRQMKFGK